MSYGLKIISVAQPKTELFQRPGNHCIHLFLKQMKGWNITEVCSFYPKTDVSIIKQTNSMAFSP
jgi:hypothetical protein